MSRYFAAALLSLALLPTAALAQGRGTPEQQRACRPDVARLCAYVGGDDYAIEACLRANMGRLRPACRRVFEGGR
jgi:hypothetical protein